MDQNKGCVRFIGEMADSLGANIQPVQLDAWLFVQKTTTSYDIVFADPPYDWDKHEALAEALIQKGFLKEGGEAIIEHSADTDLSHLPGFFEHRKYGHVHFSFFSRPEDLGA